MPLLSRFSIMTLRHKCTSWNEKGDAIAYTEVSSGTMHGPHRCLCGFNKTVMKECITMSTQTFDDEMLDVYDSKNESALACMCTKDGVRRFYSCYGALAAYDFQGLCPYLQVSPALEAPAARALPRVYFDLMGHLSTHIKSESLNDLQTKLATPPLITAMPNLSWQLYLGYVLPAHMSPIDTFVHYHVVAMLRIACSIGFVGALSVERTREILELLGDDYEEEVALARLPLEQTVQFILNCVPRMSNVVRSSTPSAREHETFVEFLLYRDLRCGYVFWRRIRLQFLLIEPLVFWWMKTGIRFQTLLRQSIEDVQNVIQDYEESL